jgi:hypothetical protein
VYVYGNNNIHTHTTQCTYARTQDKLFELMQAVANVHVAQVRLIEIHLARARALCVGLGTGVSDGR